MAERDLELVLYRGLPASGKTTLAKAWVAEDPAGRARVNRDDLRRMLHDGVYLGRDTEQHVADARDSLVGRMLRAGVSVACDDTNLRQSVARRLAEIGWAAGAAVHVVDLTHVSPEECFQRDIGREHPVGRKVIIEMHGRYLAHLKGAPLPPLEPQPRDDEETYAYVPDDSLPPAWLVDLDGTLALMDGRGPFEWHRVGEDDLNQAVADVVVSLARYADQHSIPRNQIVLLSGRDEVCRPQTLKWLDHHGIDFAELLMRPEGDTRKDAVVKLEMFRERIAPRYRVLGVLDDRDQVVAMWRSIGLLCLQVAPGAF